MSRKGNTTQVTEVTPDDISEEELEYRLETEELEGPDDEGSTFSAKDLAKELGLDPKSFRRWLRSYTSQRANKGGRWVFDAAAKDHLIEAYRSKAKAEVAEAADEDALDADDLEEITDLD